MTDEKKKYEEAIAANVAVHSAMASQYNSNEPHFRKESVDRVESIVASIVDGKQSVSALDLGCGTGFMISILKKYAAEIVGVDVTQAMLDKVNKDGDAKITLLNHDTGSVKLPQEHFDLATAYTFLDHLYDMNPTFVNCYRSLKKGGVFYADLSPNWYFWDGIKHLDSNGSYDPIVNREIQAVTKKDQEVEAEFGVDANLFVLAEYQKHVLGGLKEEVVLKQLKEVGFTDVRFVYHWFLGQASMINDSGLSREKALEQAGQMHEVLMRSMPLSRSLFKYVGFIAVK